MSGDDDLHSYWKDIRPPPLKPKRKAKAKFKPEKGFLWLGLWSSYDRREEVDEFFWYRRQKVAIPPGVNMEFRATFPQMVGEPLTIDGCGLWSLEQGGELLWTFQLDPVRVTQSVTLDLAVIVQDVEGEMASGFGFRAHLERLKLL